MAHWSSFACHINGLVVLSAVLCCLSVRAEDGSFAFTHVNVVDVVNGRILPDRTVIVSRGAIAAVTSGGEPPSGTRVIPAAGKFLIPGMWDMHAHMEMTGESFLSLYATSGVTGIRDMSSDLDFILRLREATAAGHVVGPRIFAAGPILDDAPGDWEFRMRVKTAEEGAAAVRNLGAPKTASGKHRNDGAVLLAFQSIEVRGSQTLFHLTGAEPVSQPNADPLRALDSADARRQFWTEQASVSRLVRKFARFGASCCNRGPHRKEAKLQKIRRTSAGRTCETWLQPEDR